MIVFLQFPLVDIRCFLEESYGSRLILPNWPSPTPYREFIRGFGQVIPRGKGGLCGWVGESEICSAKRAIRFFQLPAFYDEETCQEINIKCSSRHFYYDGSVVGKFELVFITIPSTISLSSKSLFRLINNIITILVTVHLPYQGLIKKELLFINNYLAKFYLLSSSLVNNHQLLLEKDWIIPGEPSVFIECKSEDRVSMTGSSKRAFNVDKYSINLNHWWHKKGNNIVRVWMLKHESNDEYNLQCGRTLRLYLQRLYAECECLRSVIKCIKSGQILPKKGTRESEYLQEYFNQTTKRIFQINQKTKNKYEINDIEDVVYESLDKLAPGSRVTLFDNLEQIRPQVFRKVEYVHERMINNIPTNIISLKDGNLIVQGDLNMVSSNSGDIFQGTIGIGKVTDSAEINAEKIGGTIYET